jgi:hypothetical protein
MSTWFLLGFIAMTAQNGTAVEPIADNSFLIEEAYNQEPDVVQHISVFTRQARSGDWAYVFTQEWPVNRFPKNQISYSLTASSGDPGGLGDSWLNWRYQWKNSERLAVAPRASLILPTGSATAGRGEGSVGLDFNLPISVTTPAGFVFHSNAGMTVVPRAKGSTGDGDATTTLRVGQSVVWQTRPRFNVLVEALYSRTQAVVAPGRNDWIDLALISPGIRWAYDLKNGLQIVPGIAVPLELTDTSASRWTVLGYLSFEHPFGKSR